jgi:putative ABC transport system permease protein
MESLFQDIRYGLRTLGKSPGFTAVAVITLALGIGVNTAIFSVLNAVLLQPLPYADPERLVMLWTEYKNGGATRVPASGPEWVELRQRSRLLKDVAAIWVSSAALTGMGEPEQVRVASVTSNFLSLWGTPPQLGRTFMPGEQGTGSPQVMVLSDGLWRRHFGANPNVVGQSIRLGGNAFTVVGVMPPGFRTIFPSDAAVPSDVQIWTTFREDLAAVPRDQAYLRMIGRLRPGVTYQQAQTEASGIARQLRSEFPEYSVQGLDLDLVPLHQDAVRDIRVALLTLFAGVGMVLLIACANVGNLLLVRASRKEKETNVRLALGASSWRIVRHFLIESILLACMGGFAGLAVARGCLDLLLALRPAGLSQLASAHLSLVAVGFSFLISMITGVLCGLAPVISHFRTNLAEGLKKSSRGNSSAKHSSQQIIVFAEVALTFVLLIGSGLMIRTFVKLLNTSPGFQSDNVLTFQIAPPAARYPKDSNLKRFFLDLQKSITVLPGVQSVGAVSHLPFDDYPNWYEYDWPEGATAQEQTTLMADHRSILPGYFRSMGVPFVAGRDFSEFDDAQRPNVIIIDESLAQRTWPNQNPLGKRLNVVFVHNFSWDRTWAVVVGVVKHVRYEDLATDVRSQVYVPYLQSAREKLAFAVRVAGDPSAILGSIREAVARLDKDIPLYKVQPMQSYVVQARTATRFTTVLCGVMAGLALFLASIGIYGLMSYWVVQRTNEIGVRMALGGQRWDIMRLVVGTVVRLMFAGLAAGLMVSLLATRLLSSLLIGVRPSDPLTLIVAAMFLAAPGLLASCLPAVRAMRVDPMVALRYE